MNSTNRLIIVLIIISCSSCDFIKRKGWFGQKEDIQEELIVVADTIVEDSMSIEMIEQETEALSKPYGYERGYTSDEYYMVVGSFISEQLAKKYAEKMQDMGYEALILRSYSPVYYRVSARSYNDLDLAVNDISYFRNNVTPRAWVHIKK